MHVFADRGVGGFDPRAGGICERDGLAPIRRSIGRVHANNVNLFGHIGKQ